MEGSSANSKPGSRGTIDRRTGGFCVRVSVGKDPPTGERIVLVESVAIEKPGNERSERAARKDAENSDKVYRTS